MPTAEKMRRSHLSTSRYGIILCNRRHSFKFHQNWRIDDCADLYVTSPFPSDSTRSDIVAEAFSSISAQWRLIQKNPDSCLNANRETYHETKGGDKEEGEFTYENSRSGILISCLRNVEPGGHTFVWETTRLIPSCSCR